MSARSVSRRATAAAAWLEERRAIGRRAGERTGWVPMGASTLPTTGRDLEKIIGHMTVGRLTVRRPGKTVP